MKAVYLVLLSTLILAGKGLPNYADSFTRLSDISPTVNTNNLNVQLNYESPTDKTNWIDKLSQKTVVLGNQELVKELASPQICVQTVQEIDQKTGKVTRIIQSPVTDCLREINNAKILSKTIDGYTKLIDNDRKGARIVQGITSVILAPLAYTLKK